MPASNVEEKHPLKQGLKPSEFEGNLLSYQVEEKHPLKQGLKQGVDPLKLGAIALKRNIH